MSEAPVRRTRTPSEVKWLANELAAVNGELERIDGQIARLEKRRGRLLQVRESLSCVAGQMSVPELPDVVPAVKPHDRFGARGGLRDFMRQVIKAAHPQGVSTSALTDAVIEAFRLEVAGPHERKRLVDNSIRSALTKLCLQGQIEPMHRQSERNGRAGLLAQSGVWRWKVKEPSWQELHQVVQRAPGAKEDQRDGSAIQEDKSWR